MNGRYEPAKRVRQTEPVMNGRRAERVGITVQRSGKSCGSWSKSVDNSGPVNIPLTHTGELSKASAEQSDDYTQSRIMVMKKRGPNGAEEAPRPRRRGRNRIRTCDDPRRGESGGRPHGPTRGEEPDRVSTVANDP